MGITGVEVGAVACGFDSGAEGAIGLSPICLVFQTIKTPPNKDNINKNINKIVFLFILSPPLPVYFNKSSYFIRT